MIVNHPTFIDAVEIADRYGLKIFPVRLISTPKGLNKVPAHGGHGHLDATDEHVQLATWARQYATDAIGVPCRPNDFDVVDDDAHHPPPPPAVLLSDLEATLGPLDSLVHTSVGGGRQLWFQSTGVPMRGKRKGEAFDYKANGYVVLTHLPDAWRSQLRPLPEPWLDFFRKPDHATSPSSAPATTPVALDNATLDAIVTTVAPSWTEGSRNFLALYLAGWLLKSGVPLEDVRQVIGALAANDEQRPSRLNALERTAARLERGEPVVGWSGLSSLVDEPTADALAALLPDPEIIIEGVEEQTTEQPTGQKPEPLSYAHLTEQRFAEVLVRRHGNDILWVLERNCWYAWTGKRWEASSLEEERRAQALADDIFKAACATKNRNAITAALKVQTRPFQRHALELARSRRTASISDFDQHPLWLNVENGTLDLTDPTTPVLRPHRREDRLTRLTPVEYNPSASSAVWEAFLTDVLPDPDLRAYLQRLMGTALIGEPVQGMVIIYGPGGTGKTSFIEAMHGTLGHYAEKTPFDTFLKKHGGGGVPNDIAKLAGSRLVFADESDEGREFSAALVKNLTGGNTITGRFLYGEFFSFAQQFILCFVCNDRPVFNNLDTGMRRRIICIPFEQVIEQKKEKDEKLIQILSDPKQTGSAILNWLIAGLGLFRREELRNPPEAVVAANQDYLDDLDPVKDFFEERVIVNPTAQVPVKELYSHYQMYAADQGIRFALGPKNFAKQVRHRGIKDDKVNGVQVWLGITLDPRWTGGTRFDAPRQSPPDDPPIQPADAPPPTPSTSTFAAEMAAAHGVNITLGEANERARNSVQPVPPLGIGTPDWKKKKLAPDAATLSADTPRVSPSGYEYAGLKAAPLPASTPTGSADETAPRADADAERVAAPAPGSVMWNYLNQRPSWRAVSPKGSYDPKTRLPISWRR